jgi:putative peptidoglycan lipid II flippase
MFGTCVYQLNNFIDSIFGSFASIVGEGGVAVLYFSYHLIMFPLGIFSTALSQAILPTFSRQALEDNRGNLTLTLSWSLRMLFLVMLPASAGFMALARPIVSVLFGAGKFDIYAVNSTASALFFYSIGLCAYGATRIIYTCFFSLKDTATPAKIAVLTLALNIILNSLLMFPLKISGLALATSASGIATSFTAFTILRKRLTGFKAEVIFYSFLRIFCASICMGAVCYLTFQKTAAWDKLLQLGFSICAGILSYVIFCFLFRVPEMGELWQRLLKKK